MPLRILIHIRSDALRNKGGDYLQAVDTMNALQGRGHSVEMSFGPREALSEFDIVHLFNSYRVMECRRQLSMTINAGLKSVFTPIWHSNDYIKNLYRIPRAFYSAAQPIREWRYCRRNRIRINWLRCLNYVSIQRSLFKDVDFLVPNSIAEEKFIKADLGISLGYTKIIPNSVHALFHKQRIQKDSVPRSGILCVGRIEPLKNQIRVLEAVKTKVSFREPIEFIGRKSFQVLQEIS